ncbi:GL15968 [Drosophila persimilis]|uniref:GL15968 n=1 Tax=Drosophila persimilis TaxID=7234 RepID=B4HCR3_DROPE|nr:GL15968 [Drosophila persimilis]
MGNNSDTLIVGDAQSSDRVSANAANTQFPASRISFMRLKVKAIFDRLESIRTEMDREKLRQMDEFDLRGLLESLTELKSNFIVAHTSLEEVDFESLSSELPGKFDSSILSLRTILQRELGNRLKPTRCSTFQMNPSESNPKIMYMVNRSR